MKVPRTVDVGPYTYSVVVEELKDDDDRGYFQAYEGIYLNTGLPKAIEGETFLHELFHAIFFAYNGEKTAFRSVEEEIVSLFATGLATTIKNNPKVMQYLMEALK